MEEKVEEGKIQGFDYRATIRDPKTGKTIKDQHYKQHISAAHGTFLERDGKFYHPGDNENDIPDPRLPKKESPIEVVSAATPIQADVKPEKKEVQFSKKA